MKQYTGITIWLLSALLTLSAAARTLPGGALIPAGFVLSSPAVTADGTLPKEFTGDGAGVSPPLAWTGAPAGVKSYALIMHHIDAQGVNYSYWVLYNIPARVSNLRRGVTGIGILGFSSRGKHAGYTPPHSKGPGAKTYTLILYALSVPPRLTGLPKLVTQEALLAALQGHILASTEMKVVYTSHIAVTGEGNGPNTMPLLPREAPAQLKLTADQQQQLAELEADVTAKLTKILTTDQLQQLQQMRLFRGDDHGANTPQQPVNLDKATQ